MDDSGVKKLDEFLALQGAVAGKLQYIYKMFAIFVIIILVVAIAFAVVDDANVVVINDNEVCAIN